MGEVSPKRPAPARCGTIEPVPDWLPPLLAASLAIVTLNVALLVQRRRERRGHWDRRLLRELRAWDGRLPEGLGRSPRFR